jgi:hypothetical protein
MRNRKNVDAFDFKVLLNEDGAGHLDVFENWESELRAPGGLGVRVRRSWGTSRGAKRVIGRMVSHGAQPGAGAQATRYPREASAGHPPGN